MDLENSQDKEKERRQKIPFQESNSDQLLKAGESGPPKEDRCVPIQACMEIPSQEGDPTALRWSV